MPPTRTTPTVIKKTERTHEENQERAYIAASRRSDRSLEARVESARRASEIHKKRTGRSLRITEQDVINEEMYEEEDDDLPMNYRLLQHRLRTDSADFNRRYLAYMTTQLSMRSALDQAYAQYFPNYDNIVNGGIDPSLPFGLPPPSLFQQPQQSPQSTSSPTMSSPRPGAPYTIPPRRTSNQSAASVPQSPHSGRPVSNLHVDSNSPHTGSQTNSPVLNKAEMPMGPHSTDQSNSSSTFGMYNFPYRPPFAWLHCQDQKPEDGNPFSSALPPNTAQFVNPLFNNGDNMFSGQSFGEDNGASEPAFSSQASLFKGSESVYPPNDATLAASPAATSEHSEFQGGTFDEAFNATQEQQNEENWKAFMTDWDAEAPQNGTAA